MKIIVITTPNFIKGEESVIPHLLQLGVDIVHIRKPRAMRERTVRSRTFLWSFAHDRTATDPLPSLQRPEPHPRGTCGRAP